MTVDDMDRHGIVQALREISLRDPSQFSLDGNNDQIDHRVISGIYYTNWSTYSRPKHSPRQIDLNLFTHLFYAFYHVDGTNGELKSTDEWADYQAPVEGAESHPNHPEGNLGELFLLKLQSQFKVLLSVGGWSNREDFTEAMQDETKVKRLSKTLVETMFRYGFDGIDFDWEYPTENGNDSKNFTKLINAVRFSLDMIETKVYGSPKRRFEITVAIPGTDDNLKGFEFEELIPLVDYWNVMCYDYVGEWSTKTGYHCNLYNPRSREDGENFSAHRSMTLLCNKYKIPRDKLVMGIAAYGRSFTNVQVSNDCPVYIDRNFRGVGNGGEVGSSSNEEGIWQYNNLPMHGTREEFDPIYGSAYCFDKRNKTFIGYDNSQSVKMKGEYVWRNDLAGMFMWESLGDRGHTKKEALMEVFVKEIRHRLKPSWSVFAEQKMIEYYVSKYPTSGYLTKYLQYILDHLNKDGQLI